MVEDDRLDAVIGLGPSILPNTSVPICILILRGTDRNANAGLGSVLFIDAEREISHGRTGRRFDPETTEKIVEVFQNRRDIPGFSRSVSTVEIAGNDFNLSTRRYVEVGLPDAPPLDAQAVISGGIPRSEVELEFERFHIFGIDPVDLFQARDSNYLNFRSEGYEATVARIEELASARAQEFSQICQSWWNETSLQIAELVDLHWLLKSRSLLISSFRTRLLPMALLDEYQLNGAFAAWWSNWYDDLRSLNQSGFQTVIDRWSASERTARTSAQYAQERVLDRLGVDLYARIETLVASERQKLVDIYRSWADRYATSLLLLEGEAEAISNRLKSRLMELGYTDLAVRRTLTVDACR